MGELTRRIISDNSKMTRIVDYLTLKGWAERRPDPADRRAQQVFITPEGTAHRAGAEAAHQLALKQWFAGLTDSEKKILNQHVQTVQNRLQQIVQGSES